MPTFKFSRAVLMIATSVALSGCYSGGGRQLPQLDYQNIAPLYVSVGKLDVSTTYVPTVESSEAAAAFITTPDVALRRYAEGRLKAQGYEGVLKFVIEDASVRHSVVEPDNSVMKWANVGKLDRYDLSIRLSLAHITPDGRQPKSATIEQNRFITVPQSYSIAKREATLRDFMQKLVSEIDRQVTTALQDRMQMAVSAEGGAPQRAAPLDSGPPMPANHVPIVKPEPLPPPW